MGGSEEAKINVVHHFFSMHKGEHDQTKPSEVDKSKLRKITHEVLGCLSQLRIVSQDDLEAHIVVLLSGKRKIPAGLISRETLVALSDLKKNGGACIPGTIVGDVEIAYRELLYERIEVEA